MKKISIAIPAYEQGGRGVESLEFSFSRMIEQTFKDFDVVIADHSVNDDIKDLCELWSNKLDIKYHRNENDRGSASANTQFSIEKSTGKFIKLLCQDDFLLGRYALETTNDHLNNNTMWMATAYYHTRDRINFERKHYPALNDHLLVVNTVGTPSCILVRNVKDLPKIDKNLFYAYDCEWYWRLWKKYGYPKLIDDETMANFLWENSVTSKITPEFIEKENKYILEKHGFLNSFNKVTQL